MGEGGALTLCVCVAVVCMVNRKRVLEEAEQGAHNQGMGDDDGDGTALVRKAATWLPNHMASKCMFPG